MNKERTELNKGNVIEIRCKKCNKLMMEYFVCGDDSAVALQNIGINMYYYYGVINYYYNRIYKWDDWHNLYADLFVSSNACCCSVLKKGI